MNLFQELNEARVFRYASTVDDMKISTVSEVWYMCLLLIELSRRYDPVNCKKYALQTMSYGQFDGIRSYATDFYNLTSILENQDRFKDRMIMDRVVTVPLMGLRRYMRDLMFEFHRNPMDRQFFMSCENYMNIGDARYRSFRRIILDLDISHADEILQTAEAINMRLTSMANNTDLQYYFKDTLYRKLKAL